MVEQEPDGNGEAQIENLLAIFQPQPSKNFYERMRRAPWTAVSLLQASRWDYRNWIARGKSLRQIAWVTLVLAVAVAGSVFAPSIGTMAQSLLRFIRPADADQIAIPLRVPWTEDAENFSAPDYFTLSLDQAQQEAGFQLVELPGEQHGLTFNGAHYNPNLSSVTLRYIHPEYTLYLSQRLLGDIEEYSSVGSSAPIEIVQVHGIDAEFVSGGWVVSTEDSQIYGTHPVGTQVEMEALWDPKLPQQILRWQVGQQFYEILTVGNRVLDKEDLIYFAERVK